MQNAHPALHDAVFGTMYRLRHAPAFATPFYQVAPLYTRLARNGLDTSLPLHRRVEMAVQESTFWAQPDSTGAPSTGSRAP